MTTKEELLHLINDKLYPKIVELIKDLGLEEAQFTPRGCYKQSVMNSGNIFSYKRDEWVQHEAKQLGKDYYYNDEADTLMRIAEAYGEQVIKLRKEKGKLQERIKALKKTGCFNEVYERIILIERF